MKRIIFVEDESVFVDLIFEFRKTVDRLFCGEAEILTLQSAGMLKHTLVTNGVELIILDLSLPDSSREETIEMIINEHANMPPILVLTGDERISTRRECLLGGAAGFVMKKHALESPNFFFAECYNIILARHRDHGNGH